MRPILAIGLAALLSACSSPRRSPVPSPLGKLCDQSKDRARVALDVALRRPEQAIAPRPPDALGRPYAHCQESLRRHSIDVDAENAAAHPERTVAVTGR